MNERMKKRLASFGVAAGIAISGGTAIGLATRDKDNLSDVSYVQDIEDNVISHDDGVFSSNNVVDDKLRDVPVRSVDLTSNVSVGNSFDSSSPESFSILGEVGSNVSSNIVRNNISKTSNLVSEAPVTKVSDIENSKSSVDSDNYELMKDAISYSFNWFNKENDSLSSVLESTYGVKLSSEQKARYNTIMKDTHDAYKKAIAAYESGDMTTFKSICDDILKNKKYLNIDDLVDIISIGINLQGDYIKDSSNYSITDGKLIIDGITVDSLYPDATYVDQSNVMSLFEFYNKKDNSGVLDIMQVPIFVARQATNPTNLTLVENNSIYTYDEFTLRNIFKNIKNLYDLKIDKENNSIDDKYVDGYEYYNTMLNLYYTSYNTRVGYFSGSQMKDFLKQYEDGIENIKVPEEIKYIGTKYWDSYSLMQDANGYAFNRFNQNYTSLSDALEATYGVKLSAEQKARYDTIMKDTQDIYNKAIGLYESGHVAEFDKIYNDIMVEKKYLNLDDLVDVISMNINSQGKVINNSKNYTISPGKINIDGVTLQSLFTNPSYANYVDVMSLINMYNDVDKEDVRVLDIMQVPIFVANQATNPCNLTMLNNNSVYSYNDNELRKKFDEIENYYNSAENVKNFSTDYVNGEVVLNGYDENGNRTDLSDSKLKNEIMQFYQFLYQFYRSNDARVGYFDGVQMKEFLAQYDNGYDNINIMNVDNSVGFFEYDCYSLMQDGLGFVLNRFEKSNISLSDILESTYNVELSAEQKARYDTLIRDTYDEYRKGIDAYLSGDVTGFRKICDEILNEKKYMNLDDVVDIVSININSQDKIINNSKNYSITDGKLIIDGYTIENLISDDYNTVIDYTNLYNGADISSLRVLDIFRAPKAVMSEAVNPTSFSLVVDGKLYAYSNNKLKEKYNNVSNYFSDNIGLTNFGIEKSEDGKVLYYGFDDESNKQYISGDNVYLKDLSAYLSIFKTSYERAKDGYVGYFDGDMVKGYLNDFENNTLSKTK